MFPAYNQQKNSIGLYNGLALYSQRAIVWINCDLLLWLLHAPVGITLIWMYYAKPLGSDSVSMRICEYRKTSNVSRTWVSNKQRVLMHGHQGWNVRHGLCHIYMIYVYIWVVYSFCLFCCLFIIVTTQFVALYKPCKPKPKPSTYDPPGQPPPGKDPKTDT